jgi:hypothetical protein
MKLLKCSSPTCFLPFWAPPDSERQYCSPQCANEARSAKVKLASVRFDTAKAREARTEMSFSKQKETLRKTLSSRRQHPERGWFENLDEQKRLLIRSKLQEMAKQRVSHPVKETGGIRRYGLRFDSKVELHLYEEFLRREIYAERPAPYRGWLVDFHIPSVNRFVEVKSWYTATTLQGLDTVISRLDDQVLIVEEKDAYRVNGVTDIWGFMEEKSSRFKKELLELHGRSKASTCN